MYIKVGVICRVYVHITPTMWYVHILYMSELKRWRKSHSHLIFNFTWRSPPFFLQCFLCHFCKSKFVCYISEWMLCFCLKSEGGGFNEKHGFGITWNYFFLLLFLFIYQKNTDITPSLTWQLTMKLHKSLQYKSLHMVFIISECSKREVQVTDVFQGQVHLYCIVFLLQHTQYSFLASLY